VREAPPLDPEEAGDAGDGVELVDRHRVDDEGGAAVLAGHRQRQRRPQVRGVLAALGALSAETGG